MTVLPESGPVFHWFLPTRGDSDTPGVIPAFSDTVLPPDRRLPTLEYLTEVARATEYAGLHSVLTPGALAVRTPGCALLGGRREDGPVRFHRRGPAQSGVADAAGPAGRHQRCARRRRIPGLESRCRRGWLMTAPAELMHAARSWTTSPIRCRLSASATRSPRPTTRSAGTTPPPSSCWTAVRSVWSPATNSTQLATSQARPSSLPRPAQQTRRGRGSPDAAQLFDTDTHPTRRGST